MDVSIITPVYNEPRVRQTVESILCQEGVPSIELVVVDGQSTDETVDILEEYRGEIDTLIREPDDGVYDAMNKGIERTSGDVVGILNADDRYQDKFVLRDVLNRLKASGSDVCYGDLVYTDEDDGVLRYWRSGPYRRTRFFFGWMPPHPTFFVKRHLYDRYGRFDLEYPISADYELMFRFLVKHGVSASYVDRILVRMAAGGQSNESIGNILKANHEVLNSWRKHEIRGGSIAVLLKLLRKLPQFYRTPHSQIQSSF